MTIKPSDMKPVHLTRQARKDRLDLLEKAVGGYTQEIHRTVIDSQIQHIEHEDFQWKKSLVTAQKETIALLLLLENTMMMLEVEYKERT